MSEEVDSAVSTGAIPGCTGDAVEVLLRITGASPAEVLDPRLTVLPDGIPYGGTDSVRDLYGRCVYNPAVLYGDPACDPDNPVGDPSEILAYTQDALDIQLLGLVIALLILTYGVLQISLSLSAGMMSVLFPVAIVFAFYLPLERSPGRHPQLYQHRPQKRGATHPCPRTALTRTVVRLLAGSGTMFPSTSSPST